MLRRCAVGIEISEDRQHTSVAAAGYVDDDESVVMVELAAYLEGTDPTAAVLKLKAERTITEVCVDPHSPAATTIKLLSRAGVRVRELSSSDVVVAYGNFLDELSAGRLKHSGQPELTAAVSYR